MYYGNAQSLSMLDNITQHFWLTSFSEADPGGGGGIFANFFLKVP